MRPLRYTACTSRGASVGTATLASKATCSWTVLPVKLSRRFLLKPPAQHPVKHACSSATSEGGSSSTSTCTAASPAAKTIAVYFRDEDIVASAAVGDELVEVAQKCGVVIPTGCWSGNCGVCEVEVYKYTGNAEHDKSAAASPAVVRACITKLPPGYSKIEMAQMQDAIWGLDGCDT
eukprot:GHRR01020501.1.p1 GENE.GHRR01020501.1~~GHRR01020501.1.p1  ORF type:complete len:177 (+),score=47.00 GHRR01020501.1:55-585(+)